MLPLPARHLHHVAAVVFIVGRFGAQVATEDAQSLSKSCTEHDSTARHEAQRRAHRSGQGQPRKNKSISTPSIRRRLCRLLHAALSGQSLEAQNKSRRTGRDRTRHHITSHDTSKHDVNQDLSARSRHATPITASRLRVPLLCCPDTHKKHEALDACRHTQHQSWGSRGLVTMSGERKNNVRRGAGLSTDEEENVHHAVSQSDVRQFASGSPDPSAFSDTHVIPPMKTQRSRTPPPHPMLSYAMPDREPGPRRAAKGDVMRPRTPNAPARPAACARR